MKIEVIHLSDIHLEDSDQTHSIDISKILSALNSTIDGEECIIVISGDLTSKGEKSEYKCVKSFVGALIKYLIHDKFAGRKIELIYVPGNHDINFCGLNISMDDIIRANSNNTIDELIQLYLSSMKSFFDFSQYYDCFRNNKIVSKKVFSYGKKKIGFVLLNTAPLSLMGGNSIDMGNHYLSDEHIDMVESATEAKINILVMHHSIEWFNSSCKDRLRKIISKNYSIVLSGHEHAPFGQSNSINGYSDVQCIQGNAMRGYTEDGNGFCGLSIDLDNADVIGYSYIWKDSLYVPQKIIEKQTKIHIPGEITVNENFYKEMSVDGYNRIIDQYYVFPGVVYNQITENENLQRIDIDFENDFLDGLSKHSKVIVTGEHKSGKSILAKRIFKYFLNKGKYPLFIESSEINKKKIEKTIDYIFAEQYESENCGYEKFKQLDREEKIAIIDEADLLPARIMDLSLIHI